MNETKLCQSCQTVKPVEDFGKRSKSSNYLLSACKPCCVKKSQAYAKAHPEKARLSIKRAQIKRLYGLNWDTYQSMLAEGCEVCGAKENLCIDHDHSCCPTESTCGKCIRGVLCNKHNKVLGYLSDSIEELTSLQNYLLKERNGASILV